jgi:hypothetical protein
MDKKEFSKSLIVIIALFAVAALLLTALNFCTAPIIQAKESAAELEPLYAVMPEAQGFETLYSGDVSRLENLPETVTGVYSESSGLGYVVTLSTDEGYTGEDIRLTMAVDSEGKIIDLQLNSYPESKDVGEEYLAQYLGQDSAMADVGLVAGVTFSSSAIKNAVNDGFNVLIDNGLIGAGVKSDQQLIMELLPVEYPGIANKSGIAQYEELDGSGSIIKGFKAENGSGLAAIVQDGHNEYLGIWTIVGGLKLLDSKGKEVDNPALLGELQAYGEANVDSQADKELTKLQRMTGESAQISAISAELYSSVTGVYSIMEGGTQLYGFAARSYGYSNLPMAIYYILDDSGAIVSMTADELIFYKDYFSAYTLNESEYKEGFVGLTGDSYTGEQAVISGATMSTQGVDVATSDVFAAFQTIG